MRISQAYLDAHGITQADVDEGRVAVPLMGGESEGNTDYGYNQSENRVWNTPTGYAPGTTPSGNFPGSGLPTGSGGFPGPPATPPPPSNMSIFTDTVRGQIPTYSGAADTIAHQAELSGREMRGVGRTILSESETSAIDASLGVGRAANTEAGRLRGIAGGVDPRFAAYQQGQFALMGQEEQGQLGAARDMFASRGLQGSTAALNAGNRVRTQFGNQRQALAGQIGMQQMGRQDMAAEQAYGVQRGGIADAYGITSANQQFRLGGHVGLETQAYDIETGGLGRSLDARTAGIEAAAILPTLDIAQQAAAGGGGGGGGGGNGLFSGLFSNLGL